MEVINEFGILDGSRRTGVEEARRRLIMAAVLERPADEEFLIGVSVLLTR
jgi:hypothetical protein